MYTNCKGGVYSFSGDVAFSASLFAPFRLTNTECVISAGCVGMRWLSQRKQCLVDVGNIRILTLPRYTLHILQFIISFLGAFYFCWWAFLWNCCTKHITNLILLLLFLCCMNDRLHGPLFCWLNFWWQLSIIEEHAGTRRRNEGKDATTLSIIILVSVVTVHGRGDHVRQL